MLGAMRDTVGKPAYFHGGRAEEVFQNQLDQVLSEHMTEAAADDVYRSACLSCISMKRGVRSTRTVFEHQTEIFSSHAGR